MKPQQDTPERTGRPSWLVGGGVAAALIAALVVLLIVVSSSGEPASELRTDSSVVTSSEESQTSAAPVGDVAEASDGSFSVVLPDGWRSVPPESDFLLTLYSRNDESNVLVTINPETTRGGTIRDSANDTLSQVETEFGGDLVVDAGGVEPTTVAGGPAVRFTYSFVGDRKARGRQVFMRHNDIEYILTVTGTPETFDANAGDYEQIQNTWTWTK